MILTSSMFALVFRVINTIAVIMVLCYFFKKYLLESIRAQMKKNEQELIDLRVQGHSISIEAKKIEQLIVKDAHEFAQMRERVIRWQNAVRELHQANDAQRSALQERARVVQEHRMKFLQNHKLDAIASDVAINRARQVLERQFGKSNMRNRYQQKLFTYMKATQQ